MRQRLAALQQCLQAVMETAAIVTLVLIVVVTVVDVIGRYFFNAPLSGATELTEFGIALVVFSALPAVTWQRGHVSVDLLEHLFSPHGSYWRQVFTDTLFTLCLMALGGRVWQLAERAARREVVSEYLSFPLSWIQYYIAVVCYITAFGMLLRLLTSPVKKN